MKRIFICILSIIVILNVLIISPTFALSNKEVSTVVKMKSISGGNQHSATIDIDGSVWTWGGNYYGQLGDGKNISRSIPEKVEGLDGFKAVMCGASHTMALKEDGTVWAWGLNLYNQLGDGTKQYTSNRPIQVKGLKDVKALALGLNHSVVLKSDGTVWSWGSNEFGQLGRKTDDVNSGSPGIIKELNGIIEIAAIDNYTVALKNDGTVWIWGKRDINSKIGNILKLDNLEDVKSIGAMENNVAALKSDGSVVLCNLYKNYGEINNINNFKNVKSISCGQYQIVALKTDGTLWQSGEAYAEDEYITAQDPDFNITKELDDSKNIDLVSCGYNHTLILKKDGIVWAIGVNKSGELGNGVAISRAEPTKVLDLNNAIDIDANSNFCIALTKDNNLKAWGAKIKCNFLGEYSSTPTNIFELINVIGVTANSNVFSVLKNDKTVWQWGNFFGEYPKKNEFLKNIISISGGCFNGAQFVGLDSSGDVWEWMDSAFNKQPFKVDGIYNVIEVSKGRYTTVALTKEGTVWSWPNSRIEKLYNGEEKMIPAKLIGLSDVVKVQSGDENSMALKKDGTVWTWKSGLNDINGLITSKKIEPKRIQGLSKIIDISKGSVALKEDGTVWTWGNNRYGQRGDGTFDNKELSIKVLGLKDIIKISSGDFFSLALDKNRQVWAWGINNAGQLGDGVTLYENKFVHSMAYNKIGKELPQLIKVNLNGEQLVFDTLPITLNERTFVPMRMIFESLGAKVEWIEDTQSINVENNNKKIYIQIGNSEAIIDGAKKQMDVPAVTINGRTMVPIRFISESLGAKVIWDEYTKTIIINSVNQMDEYE